MTGKCVLCGRGNVKVIFGYAIQGYRCINTMGNPGCVAGAPTQTEMSLDEDMIETTKGD